MRESQLNSVVELPNTDPQAFRNIVQYCFTETADLNENNVIATLDAAKHFDLDRLAEACRVWLKAHLNVNTCCVIREQAEQYSEEELANAADRVIRQHSATLIKSETFSMLPRTYVAELIARDDLDVKEEVCILEMCSISHIKDRFTYLKLLSAGAVQSTLVRT